MSEAKCGRGEGVYDGRVPVRLVEGIHSGVEVVLLEQCRANDLPDVLPVDNILENG